MSALITANVHPALLTRLRRVAAQWATGHKMLPLAATAGEILEHFTGITPSERAAKLRETILTEPWPDMVDTLGNNRTASIGAGISSECAAVLMAKAARTQLAEPVRGRTHATVDDIARSILEALLLSPADRVRVNTRARRRTPKAKPAGVNCAVYLDAELADRLAEKLASHRASRSFYISLLIEDALNGTNKAPRLLLQHPMTQPARNSKAAQAALE